MSLKSRKVRLLAAASVIGALALPASAAAVQSSTLNYQCKFPLIGSKPLKLDISLDLPAVTPPGQETGEFGVTATATAGGNAGGALGIVAGLRWLRGVNTPDPAKGMTLFAHVLTPVGGKVNVAVPVVLDPYEVIPPMPSDVVFNAKATTPSLTLDDSGTHQVVVDRLQLNLSGTDVDGNPIEGLTTPMKDNSLPTPLPFADTDRPVGMPAEEDPTFNVPCKLSPTVQNLAIGQFEVDWICSCRSPQSGPGEVGLFCSCPPPPTAPGPSEDYVLSDFSPTSINVRWTASTGGRAIDHYEITYDGVDGLETVTAPGDATSKLITDLGTDSSYLFSITAVDVIGRKSTTYTTDELSTFGSSNAPPTKPGPPTGTSTETSIDLTWAAATDVDGTVAGYDVYQGSNLTPTRTTTNALTVAGLAPNTPYSFRVEAVDNQGASSGQSAAGTVSTKALVPPVSKLNYTLAGSTVLKTLSKGTLPLKGSIAADFTVATGKFEADLVLNDTSGRLTALGFLPVTAKIGFVPSGVTTGSLNNDSNILTSSSLVRIKVKEVKLFGAIPLAGGNGCQTKSLSKIGLKSTGAFDPLTGGTLTGVYAISDLNGCGALNGLVSPLTAGGGNTISLKLAYQAPVIPTA